MYGWCCVTQVTGARTEKILHLKCARTFYASFVIGIRLDITAFTHNTNFTENCSRAVHVQKKTPKKKWIFSFDLSNNYSKKYLVYLLFCVVFRHKIGIWPGKCSNCGLRLQFTLPIEYGSNGSPHRGSYSLLH